MNRETYRKGLAARIRAAREGSGYTQEAAAKFLGMETDAYRKQENAGSMPPEQFQPFSELTGVNLHYLLTGQHPKVIPIRRTG